MNKKQILILGGAGFLGSNLVRACLDKYSNAIINVVDSLDKYCESTMDNLKDVESRINFIKGDIRDSELMDKVVVDQDYIFNCAAQTSHPKSIKEPIVDTEINCIGTLTVLESVRVMNPKAIVVYTSSSTMIGKANTDVINEDSREKPLDIYSANKGVAEKYHRIYSVAHGINTISLRFANLYGLFGKKSPAFGFVNYFINEAIEKRPITVYGDGEQIRNVMYIKDVTDIMLKSVEIPELYGESFFAASEEHLSVKDIAKQIAGVFNSEVKFIEWPDNRKKIDVDSVKIDPSKIYDIAKWKPQYFFKEGLENIKKSLNK